MVYFVLGSWRTVQQNYVELDLLYPYFIIQSDKMKWFKKQFLAKMLCILYTGIVEEHIYYSKYVNVRTYKKLT